jgi:glycosyltransferase involved in cell wall biosynthesis
MSEEIVRIAVLTTSYPRGPGDSAGHFIETEASRLAAEGHEVHVVAPGNALPAERQLGAGSLTVWSAGGGSLFGSPGALVRAKERPARLFELVRFVPTVRRILRRVGPFDRTVAHFAVPSGYPLALFSTGELEVVLHGSDVRVLVALPRVVRARVLRALFERGTSFRFVSHGLRSELSSALDQRDRQTLAMASRVELPLIEVPLAVATVLPQSGRPRWVVCGRLIASKRVDRAIREASRQNAHLTVIGDGPLRTELEQLADSLEPKARFVGQLAREETLAHIAGSDMLLHLSEAEGAPTVIREARALGVPVLATPVGDVARWALEDPGIAIFRPV